MTSDDIGTITLLLEKHFSDTKAEFAKMRQDNAEFREQVRQDMRNFEDRVNARIEALDEKLSGKIEAVDQKLSGKIEAVDQKLSAKIEAVDQKLSGKIEAVDQKLSGKIEVLQSQIAVMQNDITGLKHDVGNLFTWNYWTLSIILVLVAAPQVASCVKSLFGVIADCVGLIVSAFRKEDRQ